MPPDTETDTLPEPVLVDGIAVYSDSPLVNIDDPILHPRNARQGDVGAIADSIQKNGLFGAIVVQRSSGLVVKGNHTLKACRTLGMKQIPALVADIDDATARRFLIADNRTADLAAYDELLLADTLREIAAENEGTLNESGVGYDDDDLDEMLKRLAAGTGPLDVSPQLSGKLEHRLVILCRNEAHQAELLARFTDEGLEVKAVLS